MTYNLSDVKFIKPEADLRVSGIYLQKGIDLPVQLEDGKSAADIDLAAITGGLVKVLVYRPNDENSAYYKSILLKIKPNIADEFRAACKAKTDGGDLQFAEFLALLVKAVSGEPADYITLASLYAKMTVDSGSKGAQAKADIYDDRLKATLDECAERFPAYAEVYRELSAFHLRHGDLENARDALDKFAALTGNAKEREAARKELSRYTKILDGNNQILYAYDKMMMGDTETAVSECRKHISENGPTWEALFIIGWARRTERDYKGAMKDLLESLSLDSGNAPVYNELSICARETGERELSKTYLDIARDLDPENIVYPINLAFLHIEDGEFDAARELIEKARNLDAEDPGLIAIIKDYESRTGETISGTEVVSEEVYSGEEFERLREKESKEHHHHREV